MSTFRNHCDKIAVYAHCVGCIGFVLAAGSQALAAEGDIRNQPVPVQVISVQPQPIAPAAERETIRPQYDDAAIIAQVIGRPQPPMPPAGEPDDQEAIGHAAGTTRPWGLSVSAWEAPAFCHRPLYFEDESLERHGRTLGVLQPAASTIHFAGRTFAWPYLVGAFPPHECIYTLGRERPGTCAAYRAYRPPLSARGAATAGITAAGLSFIVP